MSKINKSFIIFLIFVTFSCSVDYSLLNNRQCDNEGRCIAGYVCDRTTMTCVKEGTILQKDAEVLIDVIKDEVFIEDTDSTDIESDIGCIPTNNGIEICDGIDNNCDGRTDEDYVCGSCSIVNSIAEECDQNIKCNICFVVNQEKYYCVSENGSDFGWKKESDIECNQSHKDMVLRCENLCRLCDGTKYGEPFTLQNESCDGRDNNCNGIVDEGDICPSYQICINGKCVEKPCARNEDCPSGKICKNNSCVSCTDVVDDHLCGTGKICVNSACVEGDCHQDKDCSNGICLTNKCCSDCCRDKKDCAEELICKENKCTQCIDGIEDLFCGIGYICEDKKCIKGECHPSLGCLFQKICVNYSCCSPGPTCCNKDSHCQENMICNSNNNCECKPLFGDCNNKYDDGCEKDLSGDINNCGLCSQKCVTPNADPQCVNGKCQIKNCKPNFKDCNQKPEDGCEIDITKDKLNCGDCNIICHADNADTKCDQSKCVISACKPNYADCDQDYTNGCEVDLSSDDNNCKDCRKKCPNDTHCINGECK